MNRILLCVALTALIILTAACVAFGVVSAWAEDSPRLSVVPSRDTVYPGQLFTVAVHQFGEVGAVQFDSGGLQVVTDTVGLPTRYVWIRASGPPRDVVITARAGALSSSALIRICCRTAAFPMRRVYLPSFRH